MRLDFLSREKPLQVVRDSGSFQHDDVRRAVGFVAFAQRKRPPSPAASALEDRPKIIDDDVYGPCELALHTVFWRCQTRFVSIPVCRGLITHCGAAIQDIAILTAKEASISSPDSESMRVW